jgi:hypothetical protein
MIIFVNQKSKHDENLGACCRGNALLLISITALQMLINQLLNI